VRVLLANHALVRIGGTETWTYEMAKALKDQGRDVTVYTFLHGPFSEQIEALDVPVISEPTGAYDVAFINHRTCQGLLGKLDCRKVFTQHGPTHHMEQAMPGGDVYVGVSEEVVATLAMRGIQADLVRNGVDLRRFTPKKTSNSKPVVLSLCKNVMGRDMVKRACERAGYEFNSVHWNDNPTYDVSPQMRDADIVVTYGRGAYEALACGKAVLVFDARGESPRADGWLTEDNVREFVQYNCSGRARNLPWTEDDIVDALLTYQPQPWGRKWAERHHNAAAMANKYLSYSRKDEFKITDDVLEVVNP